MAGTAEKSDPKLWDRVKKEVTASEKGGRTGQWSARKAQLASSEYKKKGGGYKGPKKADNHLAQWTGEDWGTKSGRTSKSTGERYLPRKAREKLSDEEYDRTTAKKRKDTAKGKQFSSQPTDVAKKAATARKPAAPGAKHRPAPARKAAAPRTTARRAAPAKPPARKTTAGKAPARRTTTARKAAPAKPAARKTTAREPAKGKSAAAKGAARKAAPGPARKPAAKRTTAAARKAPRAAATRSTKGGSKR